jgi:transcriptional regulator with XRE-family HTH domain
MIRLPIGTADAAQQGRSAAMTPGTIDVTKLGTRVSQLRELKGLSLSAMAEQAGLAKSALTKLERGETANPGVRTLSALCKVLGVTLPELLQEGPTGRDPRRRTAEPEVIVAQRQFQQLREQAPASLKEFLADEEGAGRRVPADILKTLVTVQYRGRRPDNVDDWKFLYSAMLRTIRR